MKSTTGFVLLQPTYQAIPACRNAISGVCRGGGCPCACHRPPDGLRGQGMPQEEIDAHWDRQAALCPPAGSRFPLAWA